MSLDPVPRPYIERLRVTGFRCIQDASLLLTPLHALVGPNDSGKSTILDAIALLSAEAHGLDGTEVTAFWKAHALIARADGLASNKLNSAVSPDTVESIKRLVSPVRKLRLDANAMRQPTNSLAHDDKLELGVRGHGLAAVYDALLSRRLDVFLEINKRFTALFPTAREIQLTHPSQTTRALGVELKNGPRVGTEALSDGMLYWLAFAALPYLHPTSLILVEGPETGLHPSRISEVMRMLRELANTSQIIIETHHPLVINEMQHDEVTIVTRTPEHGTSVTPLSKTKNFEQRSKTYALGELWLNYADGDLERDLVDGSPASP